jgi:hypothetical protein
MKKWDPKICVKRNSLEAISNKQYVTIIMKAPNTQHLGGTQQKLARGLTRG